MNALLTWFLKSPPRSRAWERLDLGGLDQSLHMSEADYYRLLNLADSCKKRKNVRPDRLLFLRDVLAHAEIMPIKLIRPDVVTMNTAMLLRTAAGQAIQCRLVYPGQENRLHRRISILSWLGLSLLGRKRGDTLRCGLTIEGIIYQPEINNHWHL